MFFRNLIAVTVLAGGLASFTGCARDCRTLVERRCKVDGVTPEECKRLEESVKGLPLQACEAVLYAQEKGGPRGE